MNTPPPKKVGHGRKDECTKVADMYLVEYSVLLLGLDNAGKTTLLSAIKSLYLPSAPPTAHKTVPTVGQNVSTVDLGDMLLKIWDVGGQHSLRRLWKSYYQSCHAIVFVIDSSDIGSGELESLSTAATPQLDGSLKSNDMDTLDDPDDDERIEDPGRNLGRLHECQLVLESVIGSSATSGVPILVLANKQDREDCVETVRIKEGLVRRIFEGDKGAAVRDSRVLPLSALQGTGVREAVEWVKSRVKWNTEARPPVMR